MSKAVFDRLMASIQDAIAGRIARATDYRDGRPMERHTECFKCGNVTRTRLGRCEVCGSRKIEALEQRGPDADR